MAKFEVATPDGRKFEIEAPDAQSASDTLDQYLATQGNAAPSPAYDEALAAGSQASQKFSGYQPSNGPTLGDRAMSFGQGVIEGVPIAGPWLEDRRVDLDATIAQLPGGMTPEQVREEAAARKAYLQQHAGNERLAGNIAGAVAPLAVAGLTGPAVIGRALGMTGGLGSQVGFGMLSGGAISGADTLARGGTAEDALKSAAFGGAVGGAAPLVVKGVGGVLGGMVGKGVPKAAQNVARAMQADEVTAPGLQRAMAQMGPDATLMDLGPNLQSLAGGIASVRGPGQKMLRDTITSRAKAGPARVAADVGRTIGKGQEIGGLTEQIITAQKAAADPLYAAVRDVPIKLEGNLKLVASTPLGRQAFKQGIEMAANDGVQPGTLTIGVLDYAKQALDDIASEAKRLGKGNANRQAANMARLLATEGDKIAPGYKQAREAFAGPAAVLDAIEEGKATFKADMSPADMQRLMADMTTSEKDAFLPGAQTAVADLLGNSANDDLLRAVDRELMFGQTANAVNSNSETARRTASQAMVNPDGGPELGPQGTIGLVFAAINAARGKLRATLQPKVNREMAELLTSKAIDPRQLQMLARAQKSPRPLPVAPGSLALPATPGQDFGDRPPLRLILNGMGANDPYTVQR
jgi:hypothetical protein